MPESHKIFGHGFGIGIGIVIVEHFYRTRSPSRAPVLHQTTQLLSSAGVGPGLGGFVHLFGQHNGSAGDKLGAYLVNFFKPNGHAATGGEGLNAKALAVYPDAVSGLAAQSVHRVGIVKGIGNAAVFLKIQPAGYFVFYKIDALRRAQVVK